MIKKQNTFFVLPTTPQTEIVTRIDSKSIQRLFVSFFLNKTYFKVGFLKDQTKKIENNRLFEMEVVSSINLTTLLSWQHPEYHQGPNTRRQINDEKHRNAYCNLPRHIINECDRMARGLSKVRLGIDNNKGFGHSYLTFPSNLSQLKVKALIAAGRGELERLRYVISEVHRPDLTATTIGAPRQRADGQGELLVTSLLRGMSAAGADQVWQASGQTHIPESEELARTSTDLLDGHSIWCEVIATDKLDDGSTRSTAVFGTNGSKRVLQKEKDGILATFHHTHCKFKYTADDEIIWLIDRQSLLLRNSIHSQLSLSTPLSLLQQLMSMVCFEQKCDFAAFYLLEISLRYLLERQITTREKSILCIFQQLKHDRNALEQLSMERYALTNFRAGEWVEIYVLARFAPTQTSVYQRLKRSIRMRGVIGLHLRVQFAATINALLLELGSNSTISLDQAEAFLAGTRVIIKGCDSFMFAVDTRTGKVISTSTKSLIQDIACDVSVSINLEASEHQKTEMRARQSDLRLMHAVVRTLMVGEMNEIIRPTDPASTESRVFNSVSETLERLQRYESTTAKERQARQQRQQQQEDNRRQRQQQQEDNRRQQQQQEEDNRRQRQQQVDNRRQAQQQEREREEREREQQTTKQQQQGTQFQVYFQQQQKEIKQAKVDMEVIIKNGTFKEQTVKQLRAFLKSQREPNGGNKDELLKRIQAMFE